jgi:hypothetical protein
MTDQPTPDGDPRLRLAYDEALRAIARQETTLDEFRARIGTSIAATVIATAFFSPIVIHRQHLTPRIWWALGLFVASLLAQSFLLVPLGGWRFRRSATSIIRDYVEVDDPASMNQIHRDLALHIDQDLRGNDGRLIWMWWVFSAALVALGAEMVLWITALIFHG